MQRVVRVALIAQSSFCSPLPAAPVSATPRLTVGFFDDPSFRWAPTPDANFAAGAEGATPRSSTCSPTGRRSPRTKPASPLNGDDPAYELTDLDALVRTAPRYNLQVMITISGTPKWANGGKTPNYPPTNLSTLTQFAQMLAARYNGLHAGFGSVSRWAVWNEPNLELFLTPQFDGTKIVSPSIYAKLYMAAYKGIKAGNPLAEVAVGSTSNRGRNKPTDKSGSVAPATFARLLAQAEPEAAVRRLGDAPVPDDPRTSARGRRSPTRT